MQPLKKIPRYKKIITALAILLVAVGGIFYAVQRPEPVWGALQ